MSGYGSEPLLRCRFRVRVRVRFRPWSWSSCNRKCECDMRIKIHNENPNDNKRTSESGGLVTGVMEIQQTQLWVVGEAWRGLRLLFVPMPGDRLIAECIYDSSSRKAITLGKCSGSTYTWVYVHRAAQKKAHPTQTAIKIAKNPVNCGRRGRSQHCRERKCSMKLPMALGRKQAVGVESEGVV